MHILILIMLVGINLAGFIFRPLDIWHAQGFYTQICLLVIFAWMFVEKPKRIEGPNIPLGLVFLVVGINVSVLCYFSLLQKKYNIANFYPFFNFLCLLVFYKICVTYLTAKTIRQIMVILKYTVTATLFLCVLQAVGLSQFFSLIHPDELYLNNLVTGFIGNGTHLSGFLASMIPLYLIKPSREDILSLALLLIVLCLCGTTIGDPSIAGFIIAAAIGAGYLWRVDRRKLGYLLGFILIVCTLALRVASPRFLHHFFETNGRISLWKYYWQIFVHYPITGIGLGKLNQVYQMTPYPGFRHLHLEYFQFLLELGVFGGVVIVNLITSFLKTVAQDRIQLCLKLSVIGFLLSCCLNYSAHIWIFTTYTMFFYSAFTLLNQKGFEYDSVPQRN